jgi:hypothetical protein
MQDRAETVAERSDTGRRCQDGRFASRAPNGLAVARRVEGQEGVAQYQMRPPLMQDEGAVRQVAEAAAMTDLRPLPRDAGGMQRVVHGRMVGLGPLRSGPGCAIGE